LINRLFCNTVSAMAAIVKKNKNKNKRRPADRDSSDIEAEEPEVEEPTPAKAKSQKAKASTAAGPAPGAEPVDKEALTQEAFKVIEEGISQPDAQKGNKAFIPKDWHICFAAHLGKYRKFLNKHPSKYVVVDTDNGNFVVKRAAEVPQAALEQKKTLWVASLESAWKDFCMAYPKSERDVQKFIAKIPGQTKDAPSKSSPKLSPKQSPKMSPRSSPVAEPVKKLKLKKKKDLSLMEPRTSSTLRDRR